MENSYAFACDAFRADTVRQMHVLRGDPLFTAAQVIVGSVKTTEGIIREVTPEIKGLMKKFWPGMLSLNLRPQLGLSWDLGDNNQLDRVSVRIPRAKFAKALAAQTGPLAIASASRKAEWHLQNLSVISLFWTLMWHSSLTMEIFGKARYQRWSRLMKQEFGCCAWEPSH